MKMYQVLVAICVKPRLNPQLLTRCYELAAPLADGNPDLDITTMFYHAGVELQPGPVTPWNKVARARNEILERVITAQFDYLLTIDADVVAYPVDLPTQLINANPRGVTAPMVYVEDYHPPRFYDTAAFIEHGQSHIEPELNKTIPGRNVQAEAPYWSKAPDRDLVEMDCVGTIVNYPMRLVEVARGRDEDQNAFINHPAFTDHFELCRRARETGHSVICKRSCVALHANLPKYGEAWH